ncbi:MAG TPA: hypothetical protein VMX56_04945 [Anaerolineales bacterium]|nr:hypothetical protein [Anaerolineales bacterium]
MSASKDLKGLGIIDLRTLAREYQLVDFKGQPHSALLHHLESILNYEAQSLNSLRQQVRDLGIIGASKLKKRQLATLLHLNDSLQSLTVNELRERLSNMNVANTGRLTKQKLVVACLELELERLLSISATDQHESKKAIPAPGARPRQRRVDGLKPWLGKFMQITSAGILLFSIFAILLTPIFLVRTLPASTNRLSLLRTSAQGAVSLIDRLETALQDTSSAIDSAALSLQSVSRVLDDSGPLIDSTSVLLGEALPDSIYAIQLGLIQAEDSAMALDQLLRGLAVLSPITGVRYDPEIPLNEGIANTATGLDPLPAALIDVRDQLLLATRDLDDLSKDLRVSATDLQILNADLREQKQQLTFVGTSLDYFVLFLDRLQQQLPALFWLAGLALELLIIGLAVTQAAVFIQGRSLVNTAKASGDSKTAEA